MVGLLDDTPLDTLPSRGTGLRLFLAYRVFLAGVMLVVFFSIGRGPLGSHAPDLFAVGVQAYMAVNLVSLMVAMARPVQGQNQAVSAVVLDIAFISFLMHASGGVQSGLGMLIAISIALGAISLQGRTALLLAAIASLAMIGTQGYAQLTDAFATTAYIQAGLLGISFFALAALAHTLATRAMRSEQLASQRGVDLANLAQLNDHVIRQMLAGIVVVDDERVVQIMNEAAWVLLGMPHAMRHHPLQQVCPQLDEQFAQWLDDGDAEAAPFRAIAGGRDVRAQFTRLGDHGDQGTLIVIEDTALLTAQAQQMKLASLGRLTAGIAHEIRNPLGAISHAAQLLDESPDLNPADRRMTEIIQQNSRRVNEVVQNILKLSRQDTPVPKPLVLGPWLQQQVAEIRQAHALDGKQLQIQVEPEGTTVYADAGQLRQVIEVLCDNAVRHFDRDRSMLRIQLLAGITPESGGPFIDIHDNGRGIPRKDAGQLFEPFFTTRNEGTGLGLYIARQLSEANRIRLEYLPLPGGGSCFRLSFPNPRSRKQP